MAIPKLGITYKYSTTLDSSGSCPKTLYKIIQCASAVPQKSATIPKANQPIFNGLSFLTVANISIPADKVAKGEKKLLISS